MQVNEIFYSLQGEGRLAGTPSIFIRLAGCPLRCSWCDTKYAWDAAAGAHYTVENIIEAIKQYPTRFVVITGGEPMVNAELAQLTKALNAAQYHITIETSGIKYVPDVACDLMSISPKLSNSMPTDPALATIHADSKLDLAVLGTLIDNFDYQLKFVIDSPADLTEIQQILDGLNAFDIEKVMLMPQAKTAKELKEKSPMVTELCLQTGYTFCQRLQVLFWNNQKGK